jgi:glycosyltransferase involved in cell wall biosynthesis
LLLCTGNSSRNKEDKEYIAMKVIINGRFLIHRVTGVERYAREILLELDKIIEPDSIKMAVPPEVEDIPTYKNIKVVKVGKLHNRLWEHFSFPWYVHKNKGVSLNLCNVAPLINPGIVAIHDMKIKAHPEYFSWRFRIWYELLFINEIRRSKIIITVSEFSKHEIMKYYHVDENKIVVIPNAWQHYKRVRYDESTLVKYNLQKDKYYFAMGSMEPNKNFKWIAEQAKKMSDQTFAIAGSINEKVFADGLGFECPNNIKLLGFISDNEAKTLMRDCKAFLFPSIYEGFGIPPLEAMSAGCKSVVVSDTEVMREIFSESVSYIKKDLCVETTNENNGNAQLKVLKKYSWNDSAKLLKNLLFKEV